MAAFTKAVVAICILLTDGDGVARLAFRLMSCCLKALSLLFHPLPHVAAFGVAASGSVMLLGALLS